MHRCHTKRVPKRAEFESQNVCMILKCMGLCGNLARKPRYSVTKNAGHVWTEGGNGGKIFRFQKYPDTCGRA